MKRKLLLILALCINNLFVYAQSINKDKEVLPVLVSASPNVASLGIYGDIPVSLFNGVPNVNLNLYNIKVDDFELPISLSYHLSSVKPEERHGWVGLGWNLNAGGAITRIVNGGVDEVLISESAFVKPEMFSYYTHFSNLSPENWDSPNKLVDYSNIMRSGFNTSMKFTEQAAYPAPDEFVFNVNGLSGSFFKNHEGKWVVKSNQRIDIKINEELKTDFKFFEVGHAEANSKLHILKRIFYGFTLTTDDGTQYVFGKDPNSIEFVGAVPGDTNIETNSNFIAKTWYITKIILPTGKAITFHYKTNALPDGNKGDTFNSPVFKRFIASTYLRYWTNGTISQSSTTSSFENQIVERSFIVYLDKILTDDTEVVFNSSLSADLDYPFGSSTNTWDHLYNYPKPLIDYLGKPHWYKLDNLIVKSKITDKSIYKTAFKYIENPSSRLFLKGIDEGINNASIKKHIFDYNQIPLPPYNSQMLDHWGYYNGASFVKTYVIPNNAIYTVEQLKNNYYASRNPNPAFMQAGVLTKITFPTGGYSNLFYEPHDFSKVVDKSQNSFVLISASNSNEIAGGLRLKKIESDPLNTGKKIIKEYFYAKDYFNNDFTSSGILSGRPQYIEESEVAHMKYFALNTNSFSQLNTTNGSHVTYSKVIEKLQDGSFTEYTYSNHDNGYIDKVADRYYFKLVDYNGNILPDLPTNTINSITKKIAFNSLQSERGNLLAEKKRNNFGNLVEETNYTYNNDSDRFDDKIRSIDFSETIIGETTGTNSTGIITFTSQVKLILKMAAFTVYSHPLYLKKRENIVYDIKNNSSIKTITDYSYYNLGNHHHLKSETTIDSKNQIHQKKYFYAADSEMAAEPFRNELINKNITGVPLNIKSYITEPSGAEIKTTEKLTKYAGFSSEVPGQNILLPKEIFINKGTASIANTDRKVVFDLYDLNGKVLQYTPENGVPISVIWGYNKTLPIAKLENVSYNSISPANINTLQNISNNGSERDLLLALNGLRSSFPQAMVSTYTYKSLIGMTSFTDSRGISLFYDYDDFNRLSFIRDEKLNIIERYCYNYKGQLTDCNPLYSNVLKQETFKRNCGSGVPTPIVYSVEAGKYTSAISQSDADAQADKDIRENGQTYANTYGICTFASVFKSQRFTRDNCAPGGVPETYVYTVETGKYSSTISQADADAKALKDIADNGQAVTNAKVACLFFNTGRTANFTTDNCEKGMIGSVVSYYQVPGSIRSIISQADVDAKAAAQFDRDGQAYANANGNCFYLNSRRLTRVFTKNNCPVNSYSDKTYEHVVEAHSVHSYRSQAEADYYAQELLNDGQNLANRMFDCDAITFSKTRDEFTEGFHRLIVQIEASNANHSGRTFTITVAEYEPSRPVNYITEVHTLAPGQRVLEVHIPISKRANYAKVESYL